MKSNDFSSSPKPRSDEIDRDQVPALRRKNANILKDEIGEILTAGPKEELKEMRGEPFKATEKEFPTN